VSFSDTGLTPTASYHYCLAAVDTSTNTSNPPVCVDVTMPAVVTQDTTRPTIPGGVTATAISPTQVNVTWTASTDNVGVDHYDVLRNGAVIRTPATSPFSDLTATANTAYTYCVIAYDAAPNASETPPGTACSSVTTPPAGGGGTPPLFGDDFESGGLTAWTLNSGLAVQSALVDSGSFAARANAAGAATYAYKTLTSSPNELYYKTRFNITNRGTGTVYLLRTRAGATFGALAGVYLSATGQLCYRNESASGILCAAGTVSSTAWHSVMLHVVSNGAASLAEVWLDGVKVITKNAETYPAGGISRVHLGDFASGKTFDITFDNVIVDTIPVAP
jgi:chitodextrinase